jgi:hypothetical protein
LVHQDAPAGIELDHGLASVAGYPGAESKQGRQIQSTHASIVVLALAMPVTVDVFVRSWGPDSLSGIADIVTSAVVDCSDLGHLFFWCSSCA